MDFVWNLIGGICLGLGSLAILISAIGVLRLPDMFTRLHAAGISDTLGAGLILVGLMLYSGFNMVTVKLIMILGLFFFTSPVATHALSRAAMTDGETPKLKPTTPEQGAINS